MRIIIKHISIHTPHTNISGYDFQHIDIDGDDYWIHINIGNINPEVIDKIKHKPIYKDIDIVNDPDGIYVKYYSKEKETGGLKQLEENTLFNELIHIIL